MVRTRNILIGSNTELSAIDTDRLRAGTLLYDETNWDLYILSSDKVWRSINKASTYGDVLAETSYEYNLGS